MFTYCLNNPSNYSDLSGYSAVGSTTTYCYFDGYIGENNRISRYMELVASFEAAGVTLYYSEEGALEAWSEKYLPRSKEYEYVTLLYSIETPMGTRYFTSHTYKGSKGNAIMSPNVIRGTIMLKIEDSISAANLIAQVHTHPDPGNQCNSFPSWKPGLAGGDRLAVEWLGFPDVYVIPYKKCPSCPGWLIKYSDKSTWCLDYKN